MSVHNNLLTNSDQSRLEDLLCDNTLAQLSSEEQNELNVLLGRATTDGEAEMASWELAAAAFELAFEASSLPAGRDHAAKAMQKSLPEGLASRIVADSASYRADHRLDHSKAYGQSKRTPSDSRLASVVGWCMAVGLLLALVWQSGSLSPPGVPVSAEAKVTVLRQELLKADAQALQSPWTAGKDAAIAFALENMNEGSAADTLGDIVWSQRQQKGFMRICGLAVNDPQREQYQLWIFDEQRDEKYPVDGGVFNVAIASGEVVIPITPQLGVGRPTLFAITVEKPGGVVVSSRERLPLLAAVPKS